MESNVFKFVLSISFISINSASHASDTHPKEYAFSDFDTNVFKNHVTKNVEIFYPTPLVKSINHDPIQISVTTLNELLHPALTHICYKKGALAVRHRNSWEGFAETSTQIEEDKKYWEREAKNATKLQEIYAKVKSIEALTDNAKTEVTLPANDFMLLIQYAARKIEYNYMSPAISVDREGRFKCFLPNDETKKLIAKYRAHEKPY